MRRIACVVLSFLIIIVCQVSAQELTQVSIPVIVHIPQSLVIEADKLELVFETADFQDPETALLTDEGILVTKEQAVKVRIKGNVGCEVLISALALPFRLQWRRHPSGSWFLVPFETEPMVAARSQEPGELELELDFRLLATWQDSPEKYEGTILLTVIPIG